MLNVLNGSSYIILPFFSISLFCSIFCEIHKDYLPKFLLNLLSCLFYFLIQDVFLLLLLLHGTLYVFNRHGIFYYHSKMCILLRYNIHTSSSQIRSVQVTQCSNEIPHVNSPRSWVSMSTLAHPSQGIYSPVF